MVVESGLEVRLFDEPRARRGEGVALWLAESLGPLLPPEAERVLVLERRSSSLLYAAEDGRLVLHPRLPSASVDEKLQVMATAAWVLLEPSLGPEAAWGRAMELVDPLRPDAWAPGWWPRCCRGLDAMPPPWEPGVQEREPADPGTWAFDGSAPPEPRQAWGRADLYGGFRLPLLEDWPWVVGSFAVYAPIEYGELALALEAMPLGLVEARVGGGYAHLSRGILRLNAGPLLAWNLGSALGPEQRQEGLDYPGTMQPGVWVDGELGGFQGLLRLIPEEEPGVDAWLGWDRRIALGERWFVLPFGRARWVSESLPERMLSMGGPAGVRWMDVDAYLTHRVAAGRLELEHVIPTGRFPGPAWIRPRAVFFRAGADCGYAPEYDFVGGWSAAMGLALHPVREVKGVGWLTVAAPTDLSSFVWIVWLSTWLPKP